MMKWQAIHVGQMAIRKQIEELEKKVELQESYKGTGAYSQVLLDIFKSDLQEHQEALTELERIWQEGV